jgi:predicted phosphodiesterase
LAIGVKGIRVYGFPNLIYNQSQLASNIKMSKPTKYMKQLKLLLLMLIFSPINSDIEKPEHIHLSWTQNATANTMAITWKTLTAGNDMVEFGHTENLGNFAKAEQSFSQACGRYINVVELKGLKPDTEYFYKCGRDNSFSKIQSFKTGHNSNKTFTFVSYGDTRKKINKVKEVKNAMQHYKPNFAIHTGDFVFNGKSQRLWNKWFDAMDGFIDNFPFMATLGNHDNNADNYFDQFAFPHNEKYYSFDYGNAHFLMIYNPTRREVIEPGTPQYSWIENDLKKATSNENIKWKFAFCHTPGYSASMVKRDKKLIETLYPLLEKYNVDIIFTGHKHNYERTYMLKKNKVVLEGPDFSYKNNTPGIISIVSGGGGGPLKNTKESWWTAYTEKTHHFCMVTIDGNKLSFKAIRPDHTVVDSFTITKQSDIERKDFLPEYAQQQSKYILSP